MHVTYLNTNINITDPVTHKQNIYNTVGNTYSPSQYVESLSKTPTKKNPLFSSREFLKQRDNMIVPHSDKK